MFRATDECSYRDSQAADGDVPSRGTARACVPAGGPSSVPASGVQAVITRSTRPCANPLLGEHAAKVGRLQQDLTVD